MNNINGKFLLLELIFGKEFFKLFVGKIILVIVGKILVTVNLISGIDNLINLCGSLLVLGHFLIRCILEKRILHNYT